MNVTSKGQVTIPQELRRKYHLDPNSQVDFVEENGRVFIRPRPQEKSVTRFSRLRGRADAGMSTEEILNLTRSVTAAEPKPEYEA